MTECSGQCPEHFPPNCSTCSERSKPWSWAKIENAQQCDRHQVKGEEIEIDGKPVTEFPVIETVGQLRRALDGVADDAEVFDAMENPLMISLIHGDGGAVQVDVQ